MWDKKIVNFNISKYDILISQLLQKNKDITKIHEDVYVTFKNYDDLLMTINKFSNAISKDKKTDLYINLVFDDNFFENYSYVLEKHQTLSVDLFLEQHHNQTIYQNQGNWILNSFIYKYELINDGISKTYKNFPENKTYENLIIHTSSFQIKNEELLDKFLLKLVIDLDEIKKNTDCKISFFNSSQLLASEYDSEKTQLFIDLNDKYFSLNVIKNSTILNGTKINFNFEEFLEFLSKKLQIMKQEVKYRIKYLLKTYAELNEGSDSLDTINQKLLNYVFECLGKLKNNIKNFINIIKTKITFNNVYFNINDNELNKYIAYSFKNSLNDDIIGINIKKSDMVNLDLAKNLNYKLFCWINMITNITPHSYNNRTLTTEIQLDKLPIKRSKNSIFSQFINFMFFKKINKV
ncbi:hypothetical protein RRG43_00255 [Mycoplasmopsis cynos]|uniref:MAG3720 family protein n=1 Tax=Mycoplasmopsis cynos TaxID=171284 RepID=UPI002AFF3DD9|nr:hypothetical protein [Mycoplasmopsis cynos]WQQ15515.1 hypothetical protein RRG43_00255 [Mycoplasmopsis cynos]